MSEPESVLPASTDKLLHTKLMPPRLHPTVIQRPELLARLDAGLAGQ